MITYYATGYNCLSTFDILKQSSITIDGDLNDSGWQDDDGWYLGDGNVGKYSSGGINDPLECKFKMKTDGTKLYFGFVGNTMIDTDYTKTISVARIWLNTKPQEATVYTHLYGLEFNTTDKLHFIGKRNTSLNSNKPESNWVSPTLNGAYTNENNQLIVEFSIDLAEIGNPEEFEYFVSYSNGTNNLYTPYCDNVPATLWDSTSALRFVVDDEELTSDEIIRMIEEELQ